MTLDDVAYTLAGRLVLMLHLADLREGFLTSDRFVLNEHARLRRYGFDTSRCPCNDVNRSVVRVRLWQSYTS